MIPKSEAVKKVCTQDTYCKQLTPLIKSILRKHNSALTKTELHFELQHLGYRSTISSTYKALYKLVEAGDVLVLLSKGRQKHYFII